MSWILKKSGAQVAISGGWHPKLFGKHTGTSLPRQVPQGWSWVHGDYALAWEDDPPPPPPTQEQLDAIIREQADEAATEEAKADATIRFLVTHTPRECYDKVQADVTSLATAKVMLGRFAMALSVLARDKLR